MYFVPGFVEKRTSNNINEEYLFSHYKVNLVQIETDEERKEIKNLEKHCTRLDTQVKEFLNSQEMLITPEYFNEITNQILKITEKIIILTLFPTEACNFRCPYCYESHDVKKMDDHIIQSIKKFILKHRLSGSKLQINWFGGEPTLCPEIIEEINSLALNNFDMAQGEFDSFMTTNGYLLSKEIFRKYYNLGVHYYQITLDGWTHDETRPLASGKPTLQVILQNLLDIKTLPKQYDFKIIIRYNIVNENYDTSWYDYINQLFGDDERFQLRVIIVGDWGGDTVKGLNLINEEKKNSVLKYHKEYIKKIGMDLAPEFYDTIASGMCHAAYKNGFVVRADGRIQKCTVALDENINTVGYINGDQEVVIDENKNLVWSKPELKYQCYTCQNVLQCFNQKCPYSRIKTHNTKPCVYERMRIL